MYIAPISAFFATILIFLVSLCYVLTKTHHAYKRRKYLQRNASSLPLVMAHTEYIFDTIERAKTYYLSYLLHSILCLLCRIFSAIFTICGFYMTNAVGQELAQQVLSILSVFFVLLSVYIIPQDRSRQYLLAWRQLDGHVRELLLTDFGQMTPEDTQAVFTKSNRLRISIENSLKNDEDK